MIIVIILSPFVPLSPSPTVSTSHSLHLCHHSFLANRFINIIFLDSIYMCQYTIFVFLTLLHSIWQSLGSSTSLQMNHFHFYGWESEKVGLKLNIQKTKIRASGPITAWEIGGETVETVSDFIFGGSKITADGDCSHEIKRRLLLGRKVMTNLDSMLKSRDITLPTKVHLVKAMVFPVVMYGCESWTVKKAECQRIVAFELWCWRRLF